MQHLGILMLLTMTDCGFGASLDVALGVHWSSYENQGRLGSYLSKDFASHVLLPLMQSSTNEQSITTKMLC
jgi:hypothetical protein